MARYKAFSVPQGWNDADVGGKVHDLLALGFSVEVIKKKTQGGYRIAELRTWNGERGDGSNGSKAKEDTEYKDQANPPGSLAP